MKNLPVLNFNPHVEKFKNHLAAGASTLHRLHTDCVLPVNSAHTMNCVFIRLCKMITHFSTTLPKLFWNVTQVLIGVLSDLGTKERALSFV